MLMAGTTAKEAMKSDPKYFGTFRRPTAGVIEIRKGYAGSSSSIATNERKTVSKKLDE